MAKKIDRQALIQKLKEESQNLTNDEKAQIIEFINTKRYGLVWENSTEKAYEQMKDYIPVLVEDENLRLVSDNDDAPNHILIEGDNLHALHDLCATHEGKVDVIYIDPPYNTGNKDFIYNDSFVDKEDGFRHSKWLSFIEKRLRIAKKMLSEKGVILISIDNNEMPNLKLLCDKIFGMNNNIGIVSVLNNLKGRSDDNFFATCNEFMIVYAKNKSIADIHGFAIDEEEIDNDYEKQDEISLYKLIGLRKTGTGWERRNRPYMFYPILHRNGSFTSIPEEEYKKIYDASTDTFDDDYVNEITEKYCLAGYDVHWPCTETGDYGRWRWGRDTFEKNKEINIELNRANTICSKMRATLEDGSVRMKTAKTLWYKPEYDNGSSSKILSSIFCTNKEIFSNPKSLYLIKDAILTTSYPNSIILDFFAGSGTTLHATMQLNAEDGGHRQCILVTNNENNICQEVTYERNKRVINGYTKPNGEHVPGLTNNNLRYYRTRFVPREKDLTNVMRFARNCVSLLCIKHDVYNEQEMLGNLTVNKKQFRYFKEGDKQFIVILDVEMIEPITKELANMETETPIPTYVFTTGNYPYTEDFWQVSQKVELYPYPTCIYGACEKDMPKMEDKLIDQPENIELTDDEANFSYEDLSKAENYPS